MLTAILDVLKWLGLALLALLVVLVIGLVALPPLTRGFTDAWGATAGEAAATYPGDDLLTAQREVSTKAVTVDAPPDVVYSLLVQMGQHRAGWYGWDWFYDLTKSSDFVDGHYSTRIVPELQGLKAGDEISINDAVQYTVVEAVRPSRLVLYVGSIPPRTKPSGTWSANSMAFVVRPLPDGRTRLVLRMRADGSDTGFARWLWNGPLNFGGALFSHKTIVGLARTAEAITAK